MYINTLFSNDWQQRDAKPIVRREPVQDGRFEAAFDGSVGDMFRERRAVQIKEQPAQPVVAHFGIADSVW